MIMTKQTKTTGTDNTPNDSPHEQPLKRWIYETMTKKQLMEIIKEHPASRGFRIKRWNKTRMLDFFNTFGNKEDWIKKHANAEEEEEECPKCKNELNASGWCFKCGWNYPKQQESKLIFELTLSETETIIDALDSQLAGACRDEVAVLHGKFSKRIEKEKYGDGLTTA